MTYAYRVVSLADSLGLLLVLILLLRGPVRRFWIVFGYVLWELLSTVGLTAFEWLSGGAGDRNTEAARMYARLYWSNDVIVDLLRFLLVIVLIYRATAAGVRRSSTRNLLGIVVVAALALPFILFPMNANPWPKGAWFNSTSELLNFAAAIMNLVLWGALLADRKRDPQLTAVSVGLGVVVTGAATSYGLRHLLPAQAVFIPNLFLLLTQLAGWTIWCRAFWPAAKPGNVVLNKALASPQ
jgi:hypothetical protein